MALQTGQEFVNALKLWEDDYQAGHKQLTLLELQEIKAMLTQLLTQVERDSSGPYSRVAKSPPDDAGTN